MKLEGRVSELERSSSKHDREIAAIRKLMQIGMKMLLRNERQVDKLTQSVEQLTANVKALTVNVDRVVRSLERGSRNGNKQ